MKDLKHEIKKKFKNISRFATLSGIPVHRVHDAVSRNDDASVGEMLVLIRNTEDKPLPYEVDDDLIEKVRKKFKDKNMKAWCLENGRAFGITHHWLNVYFLGGVVRFRSKRVRQLLTLLNLD